MHPHALSHQSPTASPHTKLLTADQIATFKRDGVLVVDSVLDETELQAARRGLECTLHRHGVDVHNLVGTAHNLQGLSSTAGSGGVLDVFYPQWKLNVATSTKLFQITTDLFYLYMYGNAENDDENDKVWHERHPFGPFDPERGYAYIDRIGYRIPTVISEEIGRRQLQNEQDSNNVGRGTKKRRARPIQRSLTPHLDCCPETHHLAEGKTKWRPIQCFVSLTDNLRPNTGGFEAVPGFHRNFRAWARDRPPTITVKKVQNERREMAVPAPCVGEYTHLRPIQDREILAQVQHIPVKAGGAVFWDNRIPHGNAYRNDGNEARAVVYCSFLPCVEVNRRFVKMQLEDWKRGLAPRVGDRWMDFRSDGQSSNVVDGDCEMPRGPDTEREHKKLSNLGRKLLGIDNWDGTSADGLEPPDGAAALLDKATN